MQNSHDLYETFSQAIYVPIGKADTNLTLRNFE